VYLMLCNSKSSSTFKLFISKVVSIAMPVYSFVVYEPITPCLIVLSVSVFVYLYGLDSYELVFSVREASPNMEGMIDLHHDILFFLIFVAMFLWWMFSTIILYFNDTTKPAHVYSEPVLAPVT
jgi:hypothetical protein